MADIQTTLRLNDQASNVLQKVASTARTVSSQMQATGNAIDRAFTTGAPSSFASKAGSAMESVEGQAASLGMAVDRIFEGADTSGFVAEAEAGFSSVSAGAEALAGAAGTAGNAIDQAASAAEGLGESANGMGDNNGLDGLGNDARTAGAEMDATSGKAFNLGETIKKMALAIGAIKIANGFKDFVQDSIGLGTEYTQMMAEVAAISGATGQEYAMLQDTAREYGASTIFTATQSAEALKYMSLAGWSAQQSAAGLPGVLNLAAASGMELGAASDMVTDYLTAFGMEAGEATYMADMLSYAQANSNTTAQQLGEAYLNSAAAMHSAGQDIETTTAMMEAMANQGTKGSRAGTQMAAIVRDITQKMETYGTAADLAKASSEGLTSVTGDMNDLLGTSAIQIGKMLVPVSDAKGNFRDLTDIMTDVETAIGGLGTAEASAALMDTFTDRSVRGVRQLLTEGMANVAEYEERLRHSAGAAQEASDRMNDNLAGDTAKMTSAFQEMQLQVFEGLEGTLRGGTQYLTNTIIPILTDWVPAAAGTIAGGIGRIGQALAPMLETVLRNPQAVATAFSSIGTGLAAFGAVNRISSVMSAFDAGKLSGAGGLIGAVSKFGGVLMAHPWAAGAAAVVGAITAVGLAWKHYNDEQAQINIDNAFGNVELTESEIDAFANRVIDAKWKVNFDVSIDSFGKAEELAKQAEDALAANDAIEWKARIGLNLDENDVNTYTSNIHEYIESSLNALQEQAFAMHLTLSSMDIKMLDGSSLADQVNKWAAEDTLEMQGLSDQLTQVVQKALEDGIMDVNEQEAINRLQEKMNSILAGWKLAEEQAKFDVLEMEYGKLSGKELTASSFKELMDRSSTLREEAESSLSQAQESTLMTLEALANRRGWDRNDENGEYQNARNQIRQASMNERARMDANILNLGNNTLRDTFGSEIEAQTSKSGDMINRQLSNMQSAFSSGNTESLFNIGELIGTATAGNNRELGKLWESMKPDARAATAMMDEYRNLGEKVPQEFRDSYYKAMETGAAAGDASAAMEVAAQKLVSDPAKQSLENAIRNGTANVPQQFKDAVERAAAGVDSNPVTFGSVTGELEKVDFDESKVQQLIADTIEGLRVTNQNVEVNAGEVGVEYEITTEPISAGDLAEKLGTTVDEAFANQPEITADTELQVGTKIVVSESGITVETGNTGVAVEEAKSQIAAEAEGAASDPIEVEQVVNTATVAGETDTSATEEAVELAAADPVDQTVPVNAKYEIASTDASQLGEAVSSALQTQEAAEITIPANVTITAGTVVAEEALSAAQSAITSSFGSTFEASGQVNVTLTKASDNIDAVYNQVGSEMIGNATAGRNAEMGKLWKTLQPDVQDAKTLMDQYSNLGEQAPQSFYDSYWHAMEVGAAAGDSGAAMELAAKQLVGDESKQALRDAILDGTANVPQDFKEAVERAAVTASEDPPTFEGVRGKIESMEVEFDEANVQRILADTVQGISATGQQVEVDGGEVVAEYEITTKPITAGELAEKLGTSVDEAFANQSDITTDTELQVGTKFAVSATGITVETGNAGVAVEEARAQVAAEAEGAASDPIEVEQAVNTTTVAGETDTSATQEAVELAAADPVDQTVPVNAKYEIASTDASQLGEAVSSALQTQEAAEITIPANVTITAGTVVAEEALSAAQSAITSSFGSTFEATGQVNVTLTKASDNIDAVYNQVGSEINSKFSHDYHTTANLHVSIHVDYSIANPTKTVTFSGAGSGSGTIHAHALGGYFDEPHIGLVAEAGAEYIIPMNGSNRSIEMWRDAGEMLGVNLQDYFGRAVANGSNPFEEPYVIPHADGGIFDEPHLGLVAEAGPEAAIPLDGSDRSLGLWEQAGAALGALPRPQLPAGLGAGGFTALGQAGPPAASQAPSGSNEKTININIGGNGTLRVTGGSVDKEAVVEMMMDNFKDVFMQIVEQEIVEEGEGVYVY